MEQHPRTKTCEPCPLAHPPCHRNFSRFRRRPPDSTHLPCRASPAGLDQLSRPNGSLLSVSYQALLKRSAEVHLKESEKTRTEEIFSAAADNRNVDEQQVA